MKFNRLVLKGILKRKTDNLILPRHAEKSSLTIITALVLSLILGLLLTNPVLADSGTGQQVQNVDGYTVTLTFINGNARIGENSVNIQVTDPQGQPVTNASLTVTAELYKETQGDTNNAMAGMDMGGSGGSTSALEQPLMTVMASLMAGPNSGEYKGAVDLSQAGHWMINANMNLQQKEKSVAFAVDLQKSGNNLFVVWGFLGLIIVIVAAGALTKQKSAKIPVPEEVK